MRNARKRELKELRQQSMKEVESEGKKEDEAHSAYESLMNATKKRKSASLSLLNTTWRLYSRDYAEHFHDPDEYPTKTVEFYGWGDAPYSDDESYHRLRDRQVLSGNIYLNIDIDIE